MVELDCFFIHKARAVSCIRYEDWVRSGFMNYTTSILGASDFNNLISKYHFDNRQRYLW